jgi:hypothetical protein
MERWTRRKFLTGAVQAAAGAAAAGTACAGGPAGRAHDEILSEGRHLEVSLDGPWLFRTDPDNRGEGEAWFAADASTAGWEEVVVPSTWQVSEKTAGYMGAAWYRRMFEAAETWKNKVVRIEFEAVFHTAEVFVNGKGVGGHIGKGYTAFAIDITAGLEYGRQNTVVVRVDNSFTTTMLPRDNSYDWTPDGGITRPARLIVTSPVYLECIWVDAVPDPAGTAASLAVKALIRNSTNRPAKLDLGYSVIDEKSGLVAREDASALATEIPAETTHEAALPEIILRDARLWHFDHPDLYVLKASISEKGRVLHRLSTTFGIRKIEVRGAGSSSTARPSAWPASSAWPGAIRASAWPSRPPGSNTTTTTSRSSTASSPGSTGSRTDGSWITATGRASSSRSKSQPGGPTPSAISTRAGSRRSPGTASSSSAR